jgi:hypothetical protein
MKKLRSIVYDIILIAILVSFGVRSYQLHTKNDKPESLLEQWIKENAEVIINTDNR